MKNYGRYKINFTGSKTTIERTVYEKDDKYFVKWYGEYIEVTRNSFGWKTVEAY